MYCLRHFILIIGVVMIGLVSGCGKPEDTAAIDNGLITGAVESSAVDSVSQREPKAASPVDREKGVILTRLDVVLEPGATIGQVNAALESISARIVTSEPGSPFVTVEVARQSSVDDLSKLSQTLSEQPGIAVAFIGQEAATRNAPEYETDPVVTHLEAGNFFAAWNAYSNTLDCIVDPIKLVIVDKFGSLSSLPDGMSAKIDKELPKYNLIGNVLDDGKTHGWDVAAIAAADFSPSDNTGAMPFSDCIDLTLLSVSGLTQSQQLQAISQYLHSLNDIAVVNYSLGFKDRCDNGCDAASVADGSALADFKQITPSYQRAFLAMQWKKLTHDIWDKFLIVTAAGDETDTEMAQIYEALKVSQYNSPINYATDNDYIDSTQMLWGEATDPGATFVQTDEIFLNILKDQEEYLGVQDIPAADNVIIVGSSGSGLTSDLLSDISAYAQELPDLSGEYFISGSSYAAPQVAGLAVYLWAQDDTGLRDYTRQASSMQMTIDSILYSAYDDAAQGLFNQIDALAAVLTFDGDITTDGDTAAPVRKAILDFNSDGYFNQDDLTIFADSMQLPTADNPIPLLSSLTAYNRLNLNGAGGLFGLTDMTARFDLDPLGLPTGAPSKYGNLSYTIDNNSITLDENSLTDLDILCYYAYSPLYLGDEQTRSTLLPLSVCNTDANLGISDLFTNVSGGVGTMAHCSVSGGVCVGKTVNKTLTVEQTQLLSVSDGFTAESSWSDGTGTSKATASINFSSSVVIGAENGDLMTFNYSVSPTISANTDYPDNPNYSTITSRVESFAASRREVSFTLDVPATYTASVDMSMPSRPLGSRYGAVGQFMLFDHNIDEQLIYYTTDEQQGSQVYTGVLSPGDYRIYANCYAEIDLETVNKTTPAGESDSMSGSCVATLSIVPNN